MHTLGAQIPADLRQREENYKELDGRLLGEFHTKLKISLIFVVVFSDSQLKMSRDTPRLPASPH